jgi:phosphatidate cytidylyltransferase
MKNFLVRFASGLIGAVIIVTAILASRISYTVVILIAAIGGVYEFCTITATARHADAAQNRKSRRTAIILTVAAILLSQLIYFRNNFADVGVALPPVWDIIRDRVLPNFADIAVFLPAILFFYFVRGLFSKSDVAFQNIGWEILPFIYIVLPVMLLNYLYFEKGALFTLSILFLIWFFDSMCYITGSLLGRRKLFERISPQKTIEGWAGGMLLSLVFVFFYDKILHFLSVKYHFTAVPYTNIQWLVIGFVTLVFATFGDLVESLLKRNLGIKDSGAFLPGHGGVLDRLDAILVAIPFTVLTVFIIDRISDLKILFNLINS